jgi:hypothetical protein
MTYAELLSNLRSYTEVDSSVLTDSLCDTFIKTSEYRIFRETDADYSREYATSGFTAGNKYLNLPVWKEPNNIDLIFNIEDK